MLVKGVGGIQFTIFCPNETLQQQAALRELKERITHNLGGVTELSMPGYWNPPRGAGLPAHIKVETGKVLVVITEEENDAAVRTYVQEYAVHSGEQQVLLTRNNLDVFYINKEQQ